MARKLKTFITSEGFFEKAIAAPSMKAALDAWGNTHNLFHKGFAKETDDPAIIKAAMAQPGIILRRPVGSHGTFTQHAELPRSLPPDENSGNAPEKSNVLPPKKRARENRRTVSEDDSEAEKAFEREERRREKQRQKEENLLKKVAKRREIAIAKAKSVLDESRKRHDKLIAALKAQRSVIDKKIETEDTKWETRQRQLEAALDKASKANQIYQNLNQ